MEKLERLQTGVRIVRELGHDRVIVECTHDPGYRRNHDQELTDFCRICKATGGMTQGFTLPVKMVVELAKSARKEAKAGQATLF